MMGALEIRAGQSRAQLTWALMLALGLAGLDPPAALAGPPFRTDDPVPVDYRHGELYLFATGSQAKGANEGVAPAIEANYGFAPNAMHAIAARLESPSSRRMIDLGHELRPAEGRGKSRFRNYWYGRWFQPPCAAGYRGGICTTGF